MNLIEHLLVSLGEEGSEIAQDTCKAVRFGIDDRNFLNPTGPTNRERIISELNDLLGVASLLVEYGVLPENWRDEHLQAQKRKKVVDLFSYAAERGALQGSTAEQWGKVP